MNANELSNIRGCNQEVKRLENQIDEVLARKLSWLALCDHKWPDETSALVDYFNGEVCRICDVGETEQQ